MTVHSPFSAVRLADPLIPFRLIQLSLAIRLFGWSDLEAIVSHRSSTNGHWRVICCVPAVQHTQRRYAAISRGAPIQRESRPLSLITAILSGCFRASACAARRTEPVCARVGGKEL